MISSSRASDDLILLTIQPAALVVAAIPSGKIPILRTVLSALGPAGVRVCRVDGAQGRGHRLRRAFMLLCRRLLGRPASESGTLCHGDRARGRGDRLRRAFMLPILFER